MIFKEYDGFYYIQSELLLKYNIEHFFSTIKDEKRNVDGGVNFSFTNCLSKEETLKSYEKTSKIFNVPLKNITKSTQIHEDVVKKIEDFHIGMGVTKETTINNADGLITDIKDVPLCIFSADCVPILLSNKNKTVVSAVHSGWKGTVKEITKNAINKMICDYNIKKEDILCAIGPAISKCCFEVGKEVIDELSVVGDISRFYDKKENGKYNLDLKEVNRFILIKYGILPCNIDVSDICTKCEDEYFYSYRRQGVNAGRNAAFIMK